MSSEFDIKCINTITSGQQRSFLESRKKINCTSNCNDIEIKFFETKNGKCVWECLADFNPSDVHKQVAICFKTPKYYLRSIENPVHVKIQLRRPKDGKCGECYPFILTPDYSDYKDRKRPRISRDSFNHILHDLPHVSQQSISSCTKVLTNVPYNTSEPIVENIETFPQPSLNSSGGFCQSLSLSVYNPFSPGDEWTPAPTKSTYQLTNENSITSCGQNEVKVQTPTNVFIDQQSYYPEILTTNQYNTSESESIKETFEIVPDLNSFIQSSSNTSVCTQPLSVNSWPYSPIENQLLNENPNTMYEKADINFQPKIDSPIYSSSDSTVCPTTLQSPETSTQMDEFIDFLSTYSAEIHSSNNMEIPKIDQSNNEPNFPIDDIENLSANLSASLSI